MRVYTSIIFLGLVSIVLSVDSITSTASRFSNLFTDLDAQATVQSNQDSDKSPHRGSGRREFFQSQNTPLPDA